MVSTSTAYPVSLSIDYPDRDLNRLTTRPTVSSVIVSNKYTTRLGYFLFEDPDLPENAIIDNATLKLYFNEVHYADQAKFNVGPVSENWLESSITWDNKPSIDQTQATEATLTITDTGWQNIGIKSLVEKWQDGSLDNYGLFVYPFGFLYGTAESEYAVAVKSREAGADQAEIIVEYHLEEEPSPEPTESSEEASPAPTTTPEEEMTDEEATSTLTPTPTDLVEEATPVENEEGFNFSLTTGQMIIAGLIGASLLGAVVAFSLYFAKRPKKEKPKKKTKKKSKPEDEQEEEVE